jgi:hypothetical protein
MPCEIREVLNHREEFIGLVDSGNPVLAIEVEEPD